MNIIPEPVQSEFTGGSFKISGKTKVTAPRGNPEVLKIADVFAQKLNDRGGLDLSVVAADSNETTDNEIRFVLTGENEIYGDEGYGLDISENGIRIKAWLFLDEIIVE